MRDPGGVWGGARRPEIREFQLNFRYFFLGEPEVELIGRDPERSFSIFVGFYNVSCKQISGKISAEKIGRRRTDFGPPVRPREPPRESPGGRHSEPGPARALFANPEDYGTLVCALKLGLFCLRPNLRLKIKVKIKAFRAHAP